MNYLKLTLLLSLPFFMQTPLSAAAHFKLGKQNEQVQGCLDMVDGPMIKGTNIATMVRVARLLNAFINGKVDATDKNKRVGPYTFKGKSGLSIYDLSQLEKNHPNDPELLAIIVNAKQEFEVLVTQFISQAAGVKNFLVLFIEESCRLRNREASLLRTWVSAPEGNETLIFHNEINTFEGLCLFCHDLNNFFGDLIESCPNAKEQFKKLKDDYKEHHR